MCEISTAFQEECIGRKSVFRKTYFLKSQVNYYD
jgi:hypothetical protein